MGRVGRYIIHFRSGESLTEKDIYPHEVENPDQITSVERLIKTPKGLCHLSILKSGLVDGFFLITEESRNFQMQAHSVNASPPVVHRRYVGCYLRDSDPVVRCMLGMDPRTGNTVFRAEHVKNRRPDGFAAPLEKRGPSDLENMVTTHIPQEITGVEYNTAYSILNKPPVLRVYGRPDGIGCLMAVNPDSRCHAVVTAEGNSVKLRVKPEE